MAFNINSDLMLKAIGQELDGRYGKGEIYKNFDYEYYRETYTHVTEDRIKRTFEIDKFALKRGDRDPIRLIEEDYSHHHSLKSSTYPYTTNPSNPASILAERTRQVIKQGWDEIPEPPKKKSKWKSDIKTVLQKETDEWLKNVV